MLILGIESSCDDTCASVLDGQRSILSNVRAGQDEFHARYGGIVPEIASRRHTEVLEFVIQEALSVAGVELRDLDAIAVTALRGLSGSLVVGISAAKAMAYSLGLPLVGVHHIEAHLYSPLLTHPDLAFPYICLTVSGGHTLIAILRSEKDYEVLGQSRDDAAGEAFDKVAKLLDLGFPGGPAIQRLAQAGDRKAVLLPRPMLRRGGYEFSFSGLKTAVLQRLRSPTPPTAEDLAASFQEAVVDVLIHRCVTAAEEFSLRQIAIAGGVSANQRLRQQLEDVTGRLGLTFFHLPLELCTDNAAMIAFRGRMLLERGIRHGLGLAPVAYSPLR